MNQGGKCWKSLAGRLVKLLLIICAYWLKSPPFLQKEEGDRGTIFFDDYIAKGWLSAS